MDLLGESLDTSLKVVDAVLFHLQSEDHARARAELRAQLGTILLWMLRWIRSLVEVFSLSVRVLEQEEMPDPKDATQLEEQRVAMDGALLKLKSRVEQTRTLAPPGHVPRVLPLLDDAEAARIGPAMDAWKGWLKESGQPSTEWDGFPQLERLVAELPFEKVHEVQALSRGRLKALADRCALLLHAERLRQA